MRVSYEDWRWSLMPWPKRWCSFQWGELWVTAYVGPFHLVAALHRAAGDVYGDE